MLLFGGSGRTGQMVHRAALAAGWEVEAPSHAECDLLKTNILSERVITAHANAVVNCAALSGLEACHDDPLTAHLINAVAPATMALACRHTGARFIHLSTDYVLEGHKPGLKNESTRCKPVNVYGESKREGELQVAEALPENFFPGLRKLTVIFLNTKSGRSFLPEKVLPVLNLPSLFRKTAPGFLRRSAVLSLK